MPPTFSAVLLAAGRSTRMGRDKALLELDGEPLWRRQRDVLAAAGAAEIYLSARPDQPWAGRAPGFAAVLHDAVPEQGPLTGLTAAVGRTARSHVAVLAIDLPAMTPAWFAGLAADCAPGVGVAGRRGACFEPLAAIYPRELRWLAWAALDRADFSLQRLIAAGVTAGLMRCREIGEADGALFANWNREGDFRP